MLGNCTGIVAFNIMALNKMHQLTILKKGNGRAAWRVRRKMLACLAYSVHIKACKHRGKAGRLFAVLNFAQVTFGYASLAAQLRQRPAAMLAPQPLASKPAS